MAHCSPAKPEPTHLASVPLAAASCDGVVCTYRVWATTVQVAGGISRRSTRRCTATRTASTRGATSSPSAPRKRTTDNSEPDVGVPLIPTIIAPARRSSSALASLSKPCDSSRMTTVYARSRSSW